MRSGWKSAAKVHVDRWVVEIVIPFAGLGLGEGTPTTWTANFCRNRRAGGKTELSVWQGGFNQPTTWANIQFQGINFARMEGADGGVLPTGNFAAGVGNWRLKGDGAVQDGGLRLEPSGSISARLNPAIEWSPVSVFPMTLRVSASPPPQTDSPTRKGGLASWNGSQPESASKPLLKATLRLEKPGGREWKLEKSFPIANADTVIEHNWSALPELDGQGTFQLVGLDLAASGGPVVLQRTYLGGRGLDVKIPTAYRTGLSPELSPALKWLETERLRLFYGWTLGTTPRSPGEFTNIEKVLDQVREAGFNAVALGGSRSREEDPWMAWIVMRSIIHAWKRGLRAFAHCGYLWTVWDPDYDPPALRMVDEHGETSRSVNPRFKFDQYMISPLDVRPWELGFQRARDVYAHAAELGLPDLLTGIHLDDEMQTYRQDYDYSDEAFTGYFRARGLSMPSLEPRQRHLWLLTEQRIKDYKQFQEQEVSRRIQAVADHFYAEHPEALVFIYNFLKEEWADRAWARALSSPRRPTILMDDQTYYTGHSGNSRRVPEGIEFTRKLLGHEPMYCGSILPVIDPPYPTMSPERAAQETWLLLRASHGGIVFSQRHASEDMYKTHLRYWPEWRRAFDSLQRAGILQNVPVPPRSKRDQKRADAALDKLEAWAKENWFKVWSPQPHWRHVVVTDPPAERLEAGGAVVLKKDLMADSVRADLPAKVGNQLAACRSLTYRFVVPGDVLSRPGEIRLQLKPRDPTQTYLQIVVNGVRLPLQGPLTDGAVRVGVPGHALEKETLVEIAYFYGDSVYATIFDHYIELQELSLRFS